MESYDRPHPEEIRHIEEEVIISHACNCLFMLNPLHISYHFDLVLVFESDLKLDIP